MMKAQDAKLFYFAISLVYGVIMLISLPLSVLLVFNQLGEIPHLEEFVYVAAVSFGAYIAVGILHNEYITVFKSILQFLLLLPTYINVLLIYSMCNLSDIAWGTKGLADEATLRRMQEEQALMEQELMTGAYLDAAPGVLSRGQSAQSGGSSEYKGAPPPLSQVGPPISPRGPGSVFSSISRAIDLEERERRAKQLVEDMRKKTTEMEEEYNRTIKEFSQFRLRVVFIWLTFNLVYVTVIISFDLLPYWPRAIAYILMGVTGVKLIGSIWFQLERFEVKVDVAQQGHSAVANGNGTPRTPGVGTGLGDDADTVLSGTTMGHRYGA
ncbi:CHS3, partial [Symbiodinium sp. KB8]